MPRPRRSRRTWVTVAVLVLISITIITLDERAGTHHLTSGIKSVASDVFSPVRRGIDSIVHPIGDLFAGAVDYGALQQENNKLRATIGQLRLGQAENARLRQQLRQITDLEHLTFLGSLPYTMAGVQSYDVSNFAADIVIGKGRADGVDVGMPVVGYGGLIGQVTFASKHTATITMLTDSQSKVGVTFGSSACTTCWGMLQGRGPGNPLALNFVQSGTAVRKREVIYTNESQGGVYPSNIPVARVTSYHRVSGATQITIRAAPIADLSNVAYVDVVRWEPSP